VFIVRSLFACVASLVTFAVRSVRTDARVEMVRRTGEEGAMSASISVEEAQAHLKEIIDQLAPGDEVVITEHQQPVARLVAARPAERKLGTMRGTVR
jgi:prevent-host-death family protein